MAYNGHQTAAELEREVEAQRHRVESTIGEIKERLTPGQLVDELLSYTKDGGAHFASSLGNTVTANPIPASLLAISLAWLMMGPKTPSQAQPARGDGLDRSSALPYGTIRGGGLQRVYHGRDDRGFWYSEFIDDDGRKYRARSDEAGHRAGQFMDESGRMLAGFMDEAGKRVEHFRDEAGNLLDDATNWASHTWHDLTSAGRDIAGSAAHLAGNLQSGAGHLARDVRSNAAQMSRTALHALEEQPLIAAALAFAAGAALGAALPPTKQEDEAIGAMADDMKREAANVAGDLYEQGREKVAEVYGEASDRAGEIYADAKRKLDSGSTTGTVGDGPGTHH